MLELAKEGEMIHINSSQLHDTETFLLPIHCALFFISEDSQIKIEEKKIL